MIRYFFAFSLLFALEVTPSVFIRAHVDDSGADELIIIRLNALDPQNYVSDYTKYEIEWPRLPESNILWGRRIWRTIDTRNEKNFPIRAGAGLSQSLASQFITNILNKNYKVFAGDDARLDIPLTKDLFISLLNSSKLNGVEKFDPANCIRYQIKEDWLYLASEHKLVVRILAVAPLWKVRSPNGAVREEPAFWVYYPSIRSSLRKEAITPSANQTVQNVDQFFELRRFESTVNSAGPFRKPFVF